MRKTKKPRKKEGFELIYFNDEWGIDSEYSFFRTPKRLRAIAEWFIKAADWIEAQEKKDE